MKGPLILNGLVHADYHCAGGIVVRKDEDPLCVHKPGLFRMPLQTAVRGGYSDTCNPLMMKMFVLIGLVERSGGGIYRIIKVCQESRRHQGILVSGRRRYG